MRISRLPLRRSGLQYVCAAVPKNVLFSSRNRQRLLILLTLMIVCLSVVSLRAQESTDAKDLGLRGRTLPDGFVAKAHKFESKGVDWLTIAVTNPELEALRAQVMIEKRELATHAMRLEAATRYVNGIAGAVSQMGFKPVKAAVPALKRHDFTKDALIQIECENESKEKLICGIRVWFTPQSGQCGAVMAEGDVDRREMLIWLSSVQVQLDETPPRTWTSDSGKTVSAKLKSASLKEVKLERNGGSTITVPISKLSAADQEFIKNSPLQPKIYSSKDHAARTLLPTGFTESPPISETASSFRHLNGSGIHFVLMKLTTEDVTAESALAASSEQPESSIRKLDGARMNVLITQKPSPVDGVLVRYYGVKLGQSFLLVVTESNEELMPNYEAAFDNMMRAFRTKS